MGLPVFGQNFVLDRVLGSGSPATGWVALLRSVPQETDTGATIDEPPSGVAYGRIAVSNNATNWPAAVSGRKANGTVFEVPTAPTGPWGRIRFWAWCTTSAPGTGNVIVFGTVRPARLVAVGVKPRFSPGDLEVFCVYDDGLLT